MIVFPLDPVDRVDRVDSVENSKRLVFVCRHCGSATFIWKMRSQDVYFLLKIHENNNACEIFIKTKILFLKIDSIEGATTEPRNRALQQKSQISENRFPRRGNYRVSLSGLVWSALFYVSAMSDSLQHALKILEFERASRSHAKTGLFLVLGGPFRLMRGS